MSEQGPFWERDDYGDDEDDDLHSEESVPMFNVKGEEYVQDGESVAISAADQESEGEVSDPDECQDETFELDRIEHPLDLILQEEGTKLNPIRQTCPRLSKYERARVVGKRAQQISRNAPVYVQLDEDEARFLNPLQIAELELQKGTIPFIVRRLLPNGLYEDWKLSELITN